MRKALALTTGLALSLWANSALPCGGGFGMGLTVNGAQTIVVSQRSGVETYYFSPHFCGQATSFGLILPVPAVLTSDPALGDPDLIKALDTLSAPQAVSGTACRSSLGSSGGTWDGNANLDAGVSVVNAGRVGMFDWSLLKADKVSSFTDWLDTNGYPHDAAANTQFGYYVDQGWYFVAFKVSASQDAGTLPSGSQLCGDLGPIVLSFPADKPVIPARIAAAGLGSPGTSYYMSWVIYSLTAAKMNATGATSTVKFAGTVTDAQIGQYPALKTMAVAGDRLTKIGTYFQANALTEDLQLSPAADQDDFRETVYNYTYVDCSSSSSSSARTSSSARMSSSSGASSSGSASSSSGSSGESDDGCNTTGGPIDSSLGVVAVALAALVRGLSRRFGRKSS